MNNYIYIKIYIVIFLDILSSIISLNLASFLRNNSFAILPIETILAAIILPSLFYFFGIYKRPWRYFSLSDLWYILKITFLANAFIFISIFIFNRLENIPRLVILFNFFTLVSITCAIRIIYRSIFESFSISSEGITKKIPVVFLGIGDNSETFIRSTQRKNNIYKVIGLISKGPEFRKALIRGVPVLGNLSSLQKILENLIKKKILVQRLVISPDIVKDIEISEIIKITDKYGIKVGRAPDSNEIISGEKNDSFFREISLEDLLGRRQNKLDNKKTLRIISNKIVLITGAGGSIGGELAKNILKFNPKKLLLIDHSENFIYELKRKIKEKKSNIEILFFCNDIRNKIEIEKIFREHKPQIIYHAAALKHVTICEENISEAIRTNVLATFNLTELSETYNCKYFVIISTDKAVEPSSVMGATKKMAEIIIQSKDKYSKFSNNRFIAVRFGNVLGSKGSVVPLFKEQIKAGGPITVTDKKVTRFFMTIEEAVGLVISSSSEQFLSNNNARGKISVLNMGASIKIDTLAKQMIKLAGYTPGKEIKIKYIGMKKGEKLNESLYGPKEKKIDLVNKGYFLIENNIFDVNEIRNKVEKLEELCNYPNKDTRKKLLKSLKE